MKEKLCDLLPCLLVLGLDFYLLPCLMWDTGAAMLLMLCVMPLIALIAALIFGMRRGFSLLLPLAALVLFIPSIFLFYNPTAWVYAPAYALFVLVGNILGRLLYKKK